MQKRILSLLISFLLISKMAFSIQTGSISGKVSDIKTGESIPGASVLIDGTTFGVNTDLEGNFKITGIPEGAYTIVCRYLSYNTKVFNDVIISSDKDKYLLINLEPSNVELKEVTVAAVKVTKTENSVINEVKKSNSVVSGVSSQQIAKSQDRDASEVVKRIPGVTVVENRFIVVRGLNERYNNVLLNDAPAPSSETDKKAFSFDVIPSTWIDRVLIFKTPSPELPGDFAGGVVKIYTKSIQDEASLTANVQGSARPGSTFQTFYFNKGNSNDYLGFGHATRDLKSGLPDYLAKNDPDAVKSTRSFDNSWAMKNRKALPDGRMSLLYAQPFKIKNSQFSNVTGVNYSITQSIYKIHRQDWDSTAQMSDYMDTVSTMQVRMGVIENMAFVHKNTKLEFKNLYSQAGKSETIIRNSLYEAGPNEKAYEESYQDKSTLSSQLSGTHSTDNEKRLYVWTMAYTKTQKNIPDLKRIKYTKSRSQADSMYKAAVANIVDPVNGGGRFFSKLNEEGVSFGQNLKQKIKVWNYEMEVNAGSFAEYKKRTFSARVMGYTISPGAFAQHVTRYGIDSIFDPKNIGIQADSSKGFLMDETTSLSDKYSAQNSLSAGYLSLSTPIGKKISLSYGARFEYNLQMLQSHVNLDSVHPKIETKFLLPSINASYTFSEKSLLRLAYGKTLNRPEFREWSPFYFYDFDLNAGTYGSLFPSPLFPKGETLKVAEINNFDIRFELYPASNEYVHVGVFYKDFKNPIQSYIKPGSGSDSRAYSFLNAKSAYSEGIELDIRKNLYLLFSENENVHFLNRLSMVANISLIHSELNLGDLVPDTNVIKKTDLRPQVKTALQGQSPYVVNAGFYYQNDTTGLEWSVLYNVIGPRVVFIGTLTTPNIGELPRHTLDFTVSKTFKKKLTISASVQDIFNNPMVLMEDTNRNGKFDPQGGDKEMMSVKKGSYFSLGIKMKI